MSHDCPTRHTCTVLLTAFSSSYVLDSTVLDNGSGGHNSTEHVLRVDNLHA